ncbi:MAG: HAMP domain-containing histidine kinase [Calditrichaeota bacterium]|nr:HAMP domain-containing histidine kinase [Calditrichota bacterium]
MIIPYRYIGSFKGAMFAAAVAIVLGVLYYTDRMVNDLRESSRRYLTLKVERFKSLFTAGDDAALNAYLSEMATKDFPLIVADGQGLPMSWSGVPELEALPYDAARLRAADYQREWLSAGNQPVEIAIPEFNLTFYFCYGDTPQIIRLRLLPYIEVALVGGLILIGYIGFVSIKKGEERSVWVGMARETAHQLGTPLTSLYGWVELLGERGGDPAMKEEMARDLERLRTVAERFNQIGSSAPLTRTALKPVVESAANYIRRRLPETAGNQVAITVEVPADLQAAVNPMLFEWVIENLVKNGAEAMKGRSGALKVIGSKPGRRVAIDVSDEGVGLPRRLHREIFRPGYTTKPRGWGLGLSLSRRIIEDFHRGRIFVAESAPDRGTTIRVLISG